MVVGGSGNISTAIVNLLLHKGYDVSVFCRGSNYLPPNEGAQVIRGDRHDRENFIKTMREGHYDYAIDMICFTEEDAKDDYMAFPDVKRLVLTSSGASYGELLASELPVREDYCLGKVRWSYGVNKKAAENYLLARYLENGYPVTIIRPTVTYGRQKTVVRQIGSDNIWLDRIRKGKPIIVGNPYILRNFLYADDAAYAYAGALEHEVCVGQAYNMVGLKPYDWGTYHRTMMKVLGREVEMVEIPLATLKAHQTEEFQIGEMIEENFVFNGYYSGEKIARDIPEFWERTSLEEGMRKTVAFLDENGMIPDSDRFPYEDELIRVQMATR